LILRCSLLALALRRGLLIYEPPRYMTINQCIEQLLEVEDKRKEKGTS
jgi:diphthamide biosynthesis methyltransferase